MNKKILLGTILMSAIISVTPAFALTPAYDLTGTWSFNDAGAIHTMMINSFNPVTGAFSGIGYYTVDPTLTWTITGTETTTLSGTTINYVLTVITPPADNGITITGTGTMSSSTYMSGTGDQTGYGPVDWSATKGTQVLNVMYKVTNDEDSGIYGYWALDNYNKQLQVWQDPNNVTNFYAIATYEGKWTTFKDAPSPGTGTLETKGATGTFQGGWIGEFTATGIVSNPGYKTFGNIGTFDYGGTQADVLAQTNLITPFDWMGTYFTGVSGFTQPNWGWTYHYKSQTWNNFASGNSGDILV